MIMSLYVRQSKTEADKAPQYDHYPIQKLDNYFNLNQDIGTRTFCTSKTDTHEK